jgi:hypothetical protein
MAQQYLSLISSHLHILNELAAKKAHGTASQKREQYEKIWNKSRESVDNIKELIRSIKMSSEEKIAVEDGIENLARDVESMVDRIAMASPMENQKKLLIAYKKFLEGNVEAVELRLNDVD